MNVVSARDNDNEPLSWYVYDITAPRPIMWSGDGKLGDRCSNKPLLVGTEGHS